MPQMIAVSPTTETPTPIPAWAATGRSPPPELPTGVSLVVGSCWSAAVGLRVDVDDVVERVEESSVEESVDDVALVLDEADGVVVDETALVELLGRGSSVMLK
jgi:hypothetical protein